MTTATRVGTTRDTNDKRRQVADMCRDCQLSDPNCFKEAA